MDQKTHRLYPRAPLEKIDLEQRLEKKLNHVNSLINHINNILKKRLPPSKMKTTNQKKKNKNYKSLNTVLESVDSIFYHWSKVNFKNFIDYCFWFDYYTNVSWYCMQSMLR